MRITKIMQIIEFHMRIVKKHANITIPDDNQNIFRNCRKPCEKNETHGNHRIQHENYEIQ